MKVKSFKELLGLCSCQGMFSEGKFMFEEEPVLKVEAVNPSHTALFSARMNLDEKPSISGTFDWDFRSMKELLDVAETVGAEDIDLKNGEDETIVAYGNNGFSAKIYPFTTAEKIKVPFKYKDGKVYINNKEAGRKITAISKNCVRTINEFFKKSNVNNCYFDFRKDNTELKVVASEDKKEYAATFQLAEKSEIKKLICLGSEYATAILTTLSTYCRDNEIILICGNDDEKGGFIGFITENFEVFVAGRQME